MRKITCVKCGHQDEVEDVRLTPTDLACKVLPAYEARELAECIGRGDVSGARTALEQLVADVPSLREQVQIGFYSPRARAA